MRQATAFDGQDATRTGAPAPDEAQYLGDLARLRQGAQTTARHTPVISDGQFGAFMAGINAAVAEPAPRRHPAWTTVSIATAALIIVIALLSILYPSPEPVKANTVESVTTELNNATVDWYDSKDGVTTVWVKSKGDGDL